MCIGIKKTSVAEAQRFRSQRGSALLELVLWTPVLAGMLLAIDRIAHEILVAMRRAVGWL